MMSNEMKHRSLLARMMEFLPRREDPKIPFAFLDAVSSETEEQSKEEISLTNSFLSTIGLGSMVKKPGNRISKTLFPDNTLGKDDFTDSSSSSREAFQDAKNKNLKGLSSIMAKARGKLLSSNRKIELTQNLQPQEFFVLPNSDEVDNFKSNINKDHLDDVQNFFTGDGDDNVNINLPRGFLQEFNQQQNIQKGFTQKSGLSKDLENNKTATFIFVLLGALPHLLNNAALLSEQSSTVLRTKGPFPNLQTSLSAEVNRTGLEDSIPEASIISGKSLSFAGSPTCFVDVSSTCLTSDEGFCLEGSKFTLPKVLQESLIENDSSFVSKYAEVVEQSARDLVPDLTEEQEESFDYSYFNPSAYDNTHWFGPEGYICPSKVTYSRPIRAMNARGEWRYILNDGDFFTQTVRMETCLYANTPCRLVAPCFKSVCIQKHTYHRLLSFDPCEPSKGLHVDIFRFPSACSCYAPEFGGMEDFLNTFKSSDMNRLPAVATQSSE